MAMEITAEDIKAIIDDDILEKSFDTKDVSEDDTPVSVQFSNKNNVVSGKKLREVQKKTLAETADFLAKTFGPMGSNTKMVGGKDAATIKSEYSKDGLKVLKHIMNSGPIEASIVEELIDITRHVEKEVGDGTTSTVILSSKIFDRLTKIEEKYHMPPFKLIKAFKTVVSTIEDHIRENGRDCTTQDMYDIAMISTNGNEEISDIIKQIYNDYGTDVDISLGISNTSDNQLKIYDGLLITEGFSDAAYINNPVKNTAEIPNAHIYYFKDPINTMDMIGYFESILKHNIYDPMELNTEYIPTVIC
jgi:chaperonin GroEL